MIPLWVAAYGPPGRQRPHQQALPCVGDPLTGELRARERRGPLIVAKQLGLPRGRIDEVHKLPDVVRYERLMFTPRLFRPCWDAEAIEVYVRDDLSSEHAHALYGEWFV